MSLSKDISEIFSQSKETTTVREILQKVELKSFGLLLVVLSIPSALPVPAPGYSTPFGLVLFIIGMQILFLRKSPWLPNFVLDQKIKIKKKNPSNKNSMVKFIEFFEKFLKPRWSWVYKFKITHIFLGLLISLAGFSMILPIPLTNTLPALGVFLTGLALLEEDFLAGFLGMLILLFGVFFTSLIVFLIFYFAGNVDLAIETIKTWIFFW